MPPGRKCSPLPSVLVCLSKSPSLPRLTKFRAAVSSCARRCDKILLAGLSLLLAFIIVANGAQSDPPRLPAGMDPLIRPYPTQLSESLKALNLGAGNYLKGDYAAALNALPDDASARLTAVGDYFALYRAKASLMLKRGGEALRDFHLIQTQYPDSSLYSDAVLGECQANLELHNPGAALATLQNPRLVENADTLYYQGRALEDSGARQKAMDLYLRVYCNYVNSPTAELAQERLLALSPKALTGPQSYKPLLTRADNLLRAGRNREAQALLLRLGKRPAPDKLSSEKRALFYADAGYRLGKATTVLPILRKITSADPVLHAHALYLEGACYRRLKQEDSFLKVRDKSIELYPKSPYTEQLLSAVASQFDVSNEIDEAQKAYRALYERFPKGEYAERALWRMSLFTYLKREYGEALRGFHRYLRAYPDPSSAIPAIYWMGRCYQGLGDASHARYLLSRIHELASHSYYSQRALEAEQVLKTSRDAGDRPFSGLDFDDVVKTADSIQLSLHGVTEPSAGTAVVIERARQLTTAELPDLALAELRRGIHRFPADTALSYVMARIYDIKDDYYGVITVLRRAFPDYNDRPADSLPGVIWTLLFPVKHWDTISTVSAKDNVDPYLVLGIIRQESAFKEEARSSANARGLMQVLPSTGRRVARQAGVTRYTVNKLYSAEINIALGIKHLASMLQQYNGKEELALAAYNAGDDRADRWMKEFGLADMAEFVERIPFSETRGYIKQVLTNRAHYLFLTASSTGTDHLGF